MSNSEMSRSWVGKNVVLNLIRRRERSENHLNPFANHYFVNGYIDIYDKNLMNIISSNEF